MNSAHQALHRERVNILYTSIRGGWLTYYAWWISNLLVLAFSGANLFGIAFLAFAILSASRAQSKIQKAFFNTDCIQDTTIWERMQAIISSLEGLIVSVGVMLLLDLDQPLLVYTIVFLFVAAIFSAGLSLVASIKTYYGWVAVLLLPLALTLGLSGNAFYIIIATVVTLGVISSVLLVAKSLHVSFLRTLELRFENLDLLEKLKQEKSRAEQASKDKTRFLASASHDLRQPIHAMGLFSDALENALDKPDQFELMSRIKESIDAMDELLYSLLDISQLDAGVVETNIEPILINNILDKLEATFLPLAAEKKLDLKFQCKPCAVSSDAILLENILRNILSNAIKYTEQGHVLVKCEQSKGGVLVSVEDTGIGISKESQQNIFDEFYQAHNPERDRTKGLGLGLAIVQRTCDLLGHKLSFQTEQAKGSTFTLAIAAADIQAIEPATKTNQTMIKALNACVVVIDDERTILDGMGTLLRRWGCDVILAESEADALAQLQTTGAKVDIIIADYHLREEKLGTDAAAAIRQAMSAQDLPVIIITGDTEPADLKKLHQENLHILHKPVSAMRIRTLIQNLLRCTA